MHLRVLTCVFFGLMACVAACGPTLPASVAPELARVQAAWDRQAVFPTWNALTLPPTDPQLVDGNVVCGCGYASHQPVEVEPDPSVRIGGSFTLYHPRSEPRAQALVLPCSPTDLRCFVTAHHVDGVRVVDAREPSRARVSEPLRFTPTASSGRIRALHGLGAEALVVRDVEQGYELLWLSIDPQHRPTLVYAARAAGDFRGSYVFTDAGGARYLALIVDRYDDGPCPQRVGTLLRTLRLDGGLAESQELALGVEVTRVVRSENRLLLFDFSPEGTQGLRLIDMTAPGKPELFAERFSTGYAAAHHLAGSALHVVSNVASRASESGRHIESSYSLQTLALGARAADGSFAPRLESECLVTVEVPARPGDIPVGKFRGALHGREHSELFFAGVERGLVDLRRIRRATCEVERAVLPGYAPQALADGLWFDADFATPGQSTLWVTDRRKPAQSSVAETQVRLAPQSKLFESGYRASNTFWEMSDVWPTQGGRTLASLTYHEVDDEGVARLGSQLIEIREGRPRVAAKLDSSLWQVPAEGPAVAIGAAGLVFWDLTDPQAPTRMADVPLWPRYLSAALLPAGSARLLHPSPSGKHDPLTGSTLARLEFVDSAADTQLAQASEGIDVSANASLYVVGEYVVTVAQELGRAEDKKTRPCEIRGFKLSAERKLEEVFSLLDHAMCSAEHALGAVFALQESLVFARAEHTSDESQRSAFFVLSLKEPKSARIVGPFRTPKGELSAEVSSDGVSLYSFFRVPSLSKHVGKPGFNHYLRKIDFSQPEAPTLGEAVALRGEPLLRDGDAVYTREVQKTARGPLWRIRKLVVNGDTARVSRSREVYGTALHWLQRSEHTGQLVAGWWGPGQREGARLSHFFRGLLDAATLEDLKGVAPAEQSTRIGVQAGRALRLEDGVLTWSEAHLAR